MNMRVLVLLFLMSLLPVSLFAEEWQQLFNGKDLSGWKHVGPGEMTVENGLIQTHGGMGLLYYTDAKIGDAVIRVVYKMRDKDDNSGVFIRIPIEPREAWMPVHYGYEVQIMNGADDYHATGCLYSLTNALARPGKGSGEWNTVEITLDGPRTIVLVNGLKVTDYTEGQPVPARKHDFSRNVAHAQTWASSAYKTIAMRMWSSSRKWQSGN